MRLATALLFFWFLHGHLREGRDRLQTALAAADDVADPRTGSRGLAALGQLLLAQGQSAEARLRLEAALKIVDDKHKPIKYSVVAKTGYTAPREVE